MSIDRLFGHQPVDHRRRDVQGACELLGLDPLYVANEGRFVTFVAPGDAERALATMRSSPLGTAASLIGQGRADSSGMVTMKSKIGALTC
ncbi:AIR synthase-related protein [Acidobacteria bacterium AH-259-L09]|nr:AIR synthase-related protein [Acidobacteria bacterium AH-259-L09]